MDTSETYIKMCEKAEEIQALCSYECRVYSVNMAWWDTNGDCWFNVNNERNIWLPRQDQLQEMVRGKFRRQYLMLVDFATLCVDDMPDDMSMEQLWLAFVMIEKYGKVWKGEDWCALPSKEKV